MRRVGIGIAGLLAAAAMAACGDGGNEPGGLAVARATPSGDGQSGSPGQALPAPIRVRVTTDGQPEAGIVVTWAAVGGGASVSPASGPTDAQGIAAATWTLPQATGAATATAAVDGASGSPVSFGATVAAPGSASVAVGNNFFDPATRIVVPGATVVWTWTNTGQISHSVESTGAPSFPSSATLSGSGQTYSHRFNTPGTYTYQCAVHGAGMSGTIRVE